ncbi:MAG: hypothetical protein P9M14_10300 [Candidatus Alcyoniella australis]|nr:hypothetical protein [Candidatus Alcyoniella australis]
MLCCLLIATQAAGHGDHTKHGGIHEIKLCIQSDHVSVDYLIAGRRNPRLRVNYNARGRELAQMQRLLVDGQQLELIFVEALPGRDEVLYKFHSAPGSLTPGEHRVRYAALTFDHAEQMLIRVRSGKGAALVIDSMRKVKEYERSFKVLIDEPEQPAKIPQSDPPPEQ